MKKAVRPEASPQEVVKTDSLWFGGLVSCRQFRADMRTSRHAAVLGVALASMMTGCAEIQKTIESRSEPKVTIEHDRFRGGTGIIMHPDYHVPSARPTVQVIAGFDPTATKKMTQSSVPVIFGFLSEVDVSGGWRYLRCHDVNMLVDGKRLDIGPTKHDGETGSILLEWIDAQISFEKFSTIAAAGTVEIKICNTEFQLTLQEMNGLRKVRDFIVAEYKNLPDGPEPTPPRRFP